MINDCGCCNCPVEATPKEVPFAIEIDGVTYDEDTVTKVINMYHSQQKAKAGA